MKPATDEEIAALPKGHHCPDCGCANPGVCETFMPRLIARIDADKAQYLAALNDAACLEWVVAALDGEPVSDFAESFGPVQMALDLRARVSQLEGALSMHQTAEQAHREARDAAMRRVAHLEKALIRIRDHAVGGWKQIAADALEGK